MKRVVISLILLMGLLIPIAPPASAAEKCLANFADSEWSNGTPAAVKALLGFDLVESIKKPITAQSIHRFFLYGEHTIRTTYSYIGKNCISRDVIITSEINSQTPIYQFETIEAFINSKSTNFLWTENSIKYYSNLRAYFSKNKFNVKGKQILPTDDGSPIDIQEILRNQAKTFSDLIIQPAYAFLYFPTKCAYWRNGVKEKVYAISAGTGYAEMYGNIIFVNPGNCLGELRLSGYSDGLSSSAVNEKIADVLYIVKDNALPVSISCIKGKLTKKVTAVKPQCPKGFKKK